MMKIMQYWFRVKVENVYKYLMEIEFVSTLDNSTSQVQGFVMDKNVDRFKEKFQGLHYQLIEVNDFWANYDKYKSEVNF